MNKIKQFRRIFVVIMVAIGIGIIVLAQVIERNNLTDWREPVTNAVWIYLVLVFLNVIFLGAIPSVWNHFKKR